MYNQKYNKYVKKIENIDKNHISIINSIQNGGDKFIDNILFNHNTFGFDNIIPILKSGFLKKGSEVAKKRRKLSGGIPQNEIYMNIYFKDIKNLDFMPGLIFSSKLLLDYDLTINIGWTSRELVIIKKEDTVKEKKKKIRYARKYFKNQKKYLNEQLYESYRNNKGMSHQVLFYENIPLKDYLIGITNVGYDANQIKEIRDILDRKHLDNVIFPYE